jgi:hypothetical protein
MDEPSFEGTFDTEGTTVVHSVTSFVAPDRYSVTMPGSQDYIVIGKDMYVKMDGAWKSYPNEAGQQIGKLRASFNEEGIKSISDVKYLGEDPADGKNALLYTYQRKEPGGGESYTSKLWIGKEDGLPHKIVSEYEDERVKKGIWKFRYDLDLTIEAPIKN